MVDDELVNDGRFSIRVRKGDWEIEVSAPDKSFVLDEANRLMKQFGNGNVTSSSSKNTILEGEVIHLNESNLPRVSKPQTLNEFYRQFKLQTNLDKILAFGYWCEVRQGQPHFTAEDILARYKEAKMPPPGNFLPSKPLPTVCALLSGSSKTDVLRFLRVSRLPFTCLL